MLNAEILKYGVADAKFNTFGGAGNSRPESQLSFFREKYPNSIISYNILARPDGRAQALAIEAGCVAWYWKTFGEPPAWQFLPIPNAANILKP